MLISLMFISNTKHRKQLSISRVRTSIIMMHSCPRHHHNHGICVSDQSGLDCHLGYCEKSFLASNYGFGIEEYCTFISLFQASIFNECIFYVIFYDYYYYKHTKSILCCICIKLIIDTIA